MISSTLNKITPQKDYPYMNARVKAKGAKLLDYQDYQQLVKMEENEISRKLEEGVYKKEINELASSLNVAKLVEKALAKNLNRELSHLAEISPEKIEGIIQSYVKRIDLKVYKQLIKWKKSNQEQEIEDIVSPGYRLDKERINELSEKEVEDILDTMDLRMEELDVHEVESSDGIEELERKIDTAYFKQLLQKAEETGNQAFIKFVEMEIEFENLRNLVRLKERRVEDQEIEDRLIDLGESDLIKQCISAETYEDMVERIKESGWSIESGNAEEVERQLEIKRRNKAMKLMKTNSLGLASVLAYILAKTIEVENLRLLIQSKSTGLQSGQEILDNMVISR